MFSQDFGNEMKFGGDGAWHTIYHREREQILKNGGKMKQRNDLNK
jgi:hypothetical protein